MDDLKKFILSEVQKKKMDVQTGMELLGKLSAKETKNSEIAITGMAVRFPEAYTPEEFYSNLLNKIDSVRDYPKARRKLTDPWLPDEVCDTEEPYQRQAYIDHISEFDEHFFKLSIAEAKVMEPLQRLFMMCAYEALEDANCTNTKLQDLKVGIYVGNAELGQPRYKDLSEKLDGTGFVGGANSMMPARIAYYLGLNGPGVLVDSACASGLLGATMACEALRTGKIDYAIVCGAAMNLIPVVTEKITIMESPDTIVSPFDENANGTVWGEGIGVVILKRAEQAYQEKDHVYAVICGDGTNNNGNSASITAVDVKAQKTLISSVWKKFHINPEHIKYVEAQGTGTLVGDSIEVKSLTQAFAEYTDKKQICGLGTSKCNIGHTIGASGIAALIKAALSLEAGKVPPMQRFHNPNHYINFVNSPIYITDEPIELDENNPEQMIAINNFGFNGTNVHIVLKRAKQQKEEVVEKEEAYPLFLSAKTEETLMKMLIQYQQYLRETESTLENICYTAWCGREHFEKRLAVIAKSKKEMVVKLNALKECIKDETGKTEFPEGCFYLNKVSDSDRLNVEEALLYVQGKTVEPQVFSKKNLSKVQLPVYPFELKDRWIDKPLLETINPVTGRLMLATEEQDIYQIKLDKRSWRLDTNAVPGQTVISPDVYMEIFYQYALLYERGSRVCIRKIEIPENGNLAEVEEICAVVKKEEKQITITLQVEKKEKDMLLATANIQFVETENRKSLKLAVKAELEEKTVAREIGRRDCIRKINMDEKQAVFHVELPFPYRKDEKKHALHPALLERAMTIHYVETTGKQGIVKSCKEAVINRPLPLSFDAIIHLAEEDAVYNLELSDGEGVIAKFYGVCVKEAGLSHSEEETEDYMSVEQLKGYSENGYTSTQLLLAKIWCEQLGMKAVDLDQKFFEIGGNSVIAIAVMNQLSKAGIQGVTIRTIFNYQTIRELSEYLDKFEGEEMGLVRVESQESYPLSSEQKGILSYCMLNPESRAYNLTAVFAMTGNIQITHIKEAFETIYQHNESFRTQYIIDEAGMKQIIQEKPYDGWVVEQCGHQLTEDELGQIIYEFNEPYSLEDGELLRTKYVMEDEEHGYLLVGSHHIAADGVSMGVLFEDFITLYSGGIVPDRSRRYVDYAIFSSKTDTNEYQKKKAYWIEKFSDGIPNLTLPYDYDNVEERTDKGAVFTYEIGIEQVNSLKERARELSVTASSYLLSAYSMMLIKYTGQKDIVIGMPFTGRQYKELEDVIGMFVNTLPVRIKADKEMKITDFIRNMSQESAAYMEHSGYHFEELAKDLGEEGTSQNPLYQVMFTFQNTRSKVEITDVVSPKMEFSVDGMDVKSVNYDRGIARADIMLEIVERDSTYVCYFEYSTDLFKEKTIRRMAQSMDKILSQMLSQPHMYMKDLDVIGEEERQRILYQFCGPKVAIPKGYGVIPAIMSMVEKYPEKTAVATNGKRCSYKELNERSQKAMQMYGRYGVRVEEPVVMMLERSIELISCIMGAWRIGASYIPVGIDYPVERIKTVVETSGARYIVTQKQYISKEMKETFGERLLYIEEEQEKEENALETIAEQSYQGERLAYTIFTSGSTGKPKGAMVEHAGMTNHITAKVNDLNMSNDTVIVFNASSCFDISVWQMFAALTVGGTVIIFSEEDNQNTDVFLHKIVEEEVTVLEVVPAYLRLILEAAEVKKLKLDKLKYLLVTGDVVSVGLVNRWLDTFPQIPIVNAYGPTEASDDITHCILSEKLETLSVPIGKTLQNLYIYVVDDENKLCPIGVRGEILVSGIGVGRGYMNLPEQTKKVFGNDFFIPERGRLYRSGDNGYWLEDGTLMIVGRKDYQVKLHGFRIELNEITSVIESLEEVKEAVTVVVEQDGNKYLCSYYSSEHEIKEKIEDWVSKKLPYYMIPSVFVHMEELPHNDNGKVDRKKLKKPKIEIAEKEFKQAETEKEISLEQVLKKIFSLQKINMNDSFFELGGDSILAIQVATEIKAHGYYVEIKQILKSETLSDIAHSLVKSTEMKDENMEGKFPLSAMQKKYISELQLFDTYWNQNLSFAVEGRLTRDGVLAALEQLVKTNDSLRLRFKVEENEIWQEYEAYQEGEVLFEEHTNLSLEERSKICSYLNEQVQVKNRINLGCLVEHQEKGDYVLLVVSHLVADTLSLRILMKEFLETYEAFKNGTSLLSGKTNSYKTMVARLSEYFEKDGEYESISYYTDSSRLEEVKQIWGEDAFATEEEYVNTQIEIDADIVDALKEGAAKIYQSGLDVLLLAGIGMALNEVAGVSKACIFMETDMRFAQLPDLDISHTTGWCASEYPVVFSVDCLLADCIIKAKESLDSIPFNGAGYLEVEEHLKAQGITYPAEIMFNYIGVFEGEVGNGCHILRELSGLRYGKKNRHGYGLEIESGIYENKLILELSYKAMLVGEEFISKWKNAFINNIKKIADFLSGQKSWIATPGFYDNPYITGEELQKILNCKFQIEKIYPLTPVQQGMLFYWLQNADSDEYFEQFSLQIQGQADLERFTLCYKRMIEKYEVLRTGH
nr:non-ribosomal peptide synthetase [uncultured Lachnoclostridium sp.]